MSFDDIGDNATRWLYILINGFNDIDDNATRWLCVLYTYIYIMILLWWCHEDMVMLCSTTGSYGRPMIEVAYGEMIFSLHWGCMGDDSSGRVVGVSAWCIAHVWHTWVNTSMGSVYIYIYILIFNISKSMYMYNIFKVYM